MYPSKRNIKIVFIVLGLLGCFTKSTLAFEDNLPAHEIDVIKIKRTVKTYADAYLNADAKAISTVFHPDTILLNVEDGKLEKTTMNEWTKNLNERKKKGDLRTAQLKISSISITNHMATVKLSLTFKDAVFTDYLSLLLLDNHWQIVGKIYDAQKK